MWALDGTDDPILWFGGTSRGVQGLLLVQHSGITFGCAQGTLMDVGDPIWVSRVQGKCPSLLRYLSGPPSSFSLLCQLPMPKSGGDGRDR